MSVLISGSIAFDTIMVFEGRFREHILAEQTHMLNVAFLAPQMRQEFGGCAANIAYSLRGLGQECTILGALGKDGKDYLQRLLQLGVNTSRILLAEDCYSAQAFITTDLDDNQITAFHPGAMDRAEAVGIGELQGNIAIISPNGKGAMLRHAAECHERGIPFVFDPGQAMPIFAAEELAMLCQRARWVAVNDYEGHLLSEKLGTTTENLARSLPGGMIVTRGAHGVDVYENDSCRRIDGIDTQQLFGQSPADPTGCGDAFRSGLLFGLAQEAGLFESACLGNLLGASKVIHRGGQNHCIDRRELLGHLENLYPDAANSLGGRLMTPGHPLHAPVR